MQVAGLILQPEYSSSLCCMIHLSGTCLTPEQEGSSVHRQIMLLIEKRGSSCQALNGQDAEKSNKVISKVCLPYGLLQNNKRTFLMH